jgi:RNA polymerase sigma-70 factor (ECF subfamily)
MGATGSESTDSDDIAASLVDPQRFAAVVDRHFSEIFRYLARRVGRDNAEDLGAETFTIAFSARKRYDPSRANALPWLYGIATNLIRRHRRTEVRMLIAYATAAAQLGPDGDSSEGLEVRLDHAASLARVASVFADLDPDQRDALYLVAIVGLGYAQAAEALDIPVGTVHSRVARARTNLRDLATSCGQEGNEDSIAARES